MASSHFLQLGLLRVSYFPLLFSWTNYTIGTYIFSWVSQLLFFVSRWSLAAFPFRDGSDLPREVSSTTPLFIFCWCPQLRNNSHCFVYATYSLMCLLCTWYFYFFIPEYFTYKYLCYLSNVYAQTFQVAIINFLSFFVLVCCCLLLFHNYLHLVSFLARGVLPVLFYGCPFLYGVLPYSMWTVINPFI